jgi:hypothetical protein
VSPAAETRLRRTGVTLQLLLALSLLLFKFLLALLLIVYIQQALA